MMIALPAPAETVPHAADDPLLTCLALLTRYYGQPRSVEVLRACLADPVGPIGPSDLVRAAERCDLAARVVRKPLAALHGLLLPALVFLKGGRAGILVGQDGGQASVITPELGEAQTVPVAELEDAYLGYVLLARPRAAAASEPGWGEATGDRHRDWLGRTFGHNVGIYGQAALASVLTNLIALISPFFVMLVFDRVLPNDALDTLWMLVLGAVLAFGFDALLRSLRIYFIDVAGSRSQASLSRRVFEHAVDMDMARRPPSAGGFTHIVRELDTLNEFMTMAAIVTVVDVPFALVFGVIIWLIGGPMVVVLIATGVIVLGVALIAQVPLARLASGMQRQGEHKNAILFETFSALETVKTLGAAPRMRRRWETAVADGVMLGRRGRFWSQLTGQTALTMSQLSSIGMVAYGVVLAQSGVVSPGSLFACMMLSGRALAPMSQVAMALAKLHQALAAHRAIHRLLAVPLERDESRGFVHRPRLFGQYEFRKMSFTYGAVPAASAGAGAGAAAGAGPPAAGGEPALREVSLTIAPGERVGLIGKVGSGKSTLLRLALGLYRPTEGAVLADGVDLRQIDPVELRRNIGFVAQEVVLFRGTLRDNMTFGAAWVDQATVERAARLAGVDEFAGRHPRGYDLMIGERGEGLSGGQRQAVSVARALLLDPPILLLDEPSSGMDQRSEDQLRESLKMYRFFARGDLPAPHHRDSCQTRCSHF